MCDHNHNLIIIMLVISFISAPLMGVPDSQCQCPSPDFFPWWTDPQFPLSGFYEVNIEPSNTYETTDILYCYPTWSYQILLNAFMTIFEAEGDGDYCILDTFGEGIRQYEWFPGDKPATYTASGGGQILNQSIWSSDVRYVMPALDLLSSNVVISIAEPLECDIDDTGSIRTDMHTVRLWRGPYFSGHSVASSGQGDGEPYVVFQDNVLPTLGPHGESWNPQVRIREVWNWVAALTPSMGADNGESDLVLGQHEIYDLWGWAPNGINWPIDPSNPSAFCHPPTDSPPCYDALVAADPADGHLDHAVTGTGIQRWDWRHTNTHCHSGAPAEYDGWVKLEDAMLVFIGIQFSQIVPEPHTGTVGYVYQRGPVPQVNIPVQYVEGEVQIP